MIIKTCELFYEIIGVKTRLLKYQEYINKLGDYL